MRAGPGAAVVTLFVMAACTGGDGAGGGPPTTRQTVIATAPAPIPSTTPSPTTTTVAVADPAGSVSLRVTAFTLPDLRSGGTGMRLVVRASSPRLTVRRRGGGGVVSACPVGTVTEAVVAGSCVDLGPQGAVELVAAGGVELRATGPDADVDEVTVSYVPASRSTTVVTPARAAGACAAVACEATFSLLPGRPGAFALDGQGAGGRPRLVLTAVPIAGSAGSNRTLATVEGGGSLSIRASLTAAEEARLLHHQQGPGAIAPVSAEILWP